MHHSRIGCLMHSPYLWRAVLYAFRASSSVVCRAVCHPFVLIFCMPCCILSVRPHLLYAVLCAICASSSCKCFWTECFLVEPLKFQPSFLPASCVHHHSSFVSLVSKLRSGLPVPLNRSLFPRTDEGFAIHVLIQVLMYCASWVFYYAWMVCAS